MNLQLWCVLLLLAKVLARPTPWALQPAAAISAAEGAAQQ
jgi:hypothetical protein